MHKPKLLKSKKGIDFMYIVLGFFLVALVMYGCVKTAGQNQFKTKYAGEASIALLETEMEATNMRFYIDRSAYLSTEQTLYDLSKTGGFEDESPCGSINGDSIISLHQCQPNTQASYQNMFDTHLKNHLQLYNKNKIADNYQYAIVDYTPFTVKGTSFQKMLVPIVKEKSYDDSFIIFDPSFTGKYDFDFGNFARINEETYDLISDYYQIGPIERREDLKKAMSSNWQLVETLPDKNNFATTFSTILNLIKNQEAEKCIYQWNIANDALKGHKLLINPDEAVLQDDSSQNIGEPKSTLTTLYYANENLVSDKPDLLKDENEKYTFAIKEDEYKYTSDDGYMSQKMFQDMTFYKEGEKIALISQTEFLARTKYYRDLPTCFEVNHIKIDTAKEFFAYDAKDGKIQPRPIIITFALYFPGGGKNDIQAPSIPPDENIPTVSPPTQISSQIEYNEPPLALNFEQLSNINNRLGIQQKSTEEINGIIKRKVQEFWQDSANQDIKAIIISENNYISIIKAMVKQESSYRQFATRCEKSYEERDLITHYKQAPWNFDCTEANCQYKVKSTDKGAYTPCKKISASHGLMQILYGTAIEECGFRKDPFKLYDAEENIDCGIKVLASYIQKCNNDVDSKSEILKKGIMAYNAGPGRACKHGKTAVELSKSLLNSYLADLATECKEFKCVLG